MIHSNETHNHSHEHDHNHSCISLVPIFNHLEQEEMDEINASTHTVSYKRGEIIYHAGEQSDALYIVHEGKIKIYNLSESGKQQLLRILKPGDFTGELSLFSESTHESYSEAMENTSICIFKRSDLQKLLLKYPTISLKLLNEFSKILKDSHKQTTRFATERVETRIALYLAECAEENHSNTFELPMTKVNLASYLGTTPETISRKLTDLEDEGLIKKNGKKIKILDLDGLMLI
ncbi:MAG: Crp/Fnr family transcriptional regulator [Sedimentibacter sp.]